MVYEKIHYCKCARSHAAYLRMTLLDPKILNHIKERKQERMRKNNPLHDPIVKAKCIKFLQKGTSEKTQKMWQNKDFREKQINSRKGKHYSSKTEFKKGHKFSLDIESKRVAKVVARRLTKPSFLEKFIIDVIDKHNLPYKFVGNGKFWLGYPPKNPDFMNCNGQKILVEATTNWNRGQDYIDERSKHFAQYGFTTRFIWWDELFDAQRKPLENAEQIVVERLF